MNGAAGPQSCTACCKLRPYVEDVEEWHQTRCGKVDQKNLMRLHIIGGPGSGKTTLAREIGRVLGIEVHELDQIAFSGPDYVKRPLPERMADIVCIANRPAWITEGIFILWIDELLARANIIIWLDHVGWRTSFWRITRRFVRSAVSEVKNRPGRQKFTRFQDYTRHLKQLTQVFFSTRAYYAYDRPRTIALIDTRRSAAAHLAQYRNKVVHCYEAKAISALIDHIHLRNT